MTLKEFEKKWKLSRDEMAILLSIPKNTLDKWGSAKSGRQMQPGVMKTLDLIDQTWEQWGMWARQRDQLPPEFSDFFDIVQDRIRK